MDRQSHPVGAPSAELSSIRFARLAQRLSASAREMGLEPPAFRSPPRRPGLRRAVQYRADGSATVAVAVRNRPAPAVMADLIDGLVHVNKDRLGPNELAAVRDQLWAVVVEQETSGSESDSRVRAA